MKSLFVLIIFSLYVLNLSGQRMRQYDTSSGLSENAVKGILQDSIGYIWLATQDGLNCFNGREFKSYGCSYKNTDDTNLNTVSVIAILQHSDGQRIWLATQSSSLYLFDPRTEQFREFRLLEFADYNLCYCLCYDRNGKLWIGTDVGVFVYDEASAEVTGYSTSNSALPSRHIHAIYRDSQNHIWIAGENGVSKYNPSIGDFVNVEIDRTSFPKNGNISVSCLYEDALGNLWVGTRSSLAKIDKDNNLLVYVRPEGDEHLISHMRIRDISSDTPGTLMLSTNIGLFKYDMLSNTLQQTVISSFLPTDMIYISFKDREGGIWLGSYFSGLFYISPSAREIECFTRHNVLNGFNGSAVSSFCEDADKMIYIGTENGGLSCFNPSERKFVPIKNNMEGDNVHALALHGKYLYAGTFAEGLKRIDLNSGKMRTFFPCSVFSLFKSRDAKLYVGTNEGCHVCDLDAPAEKFEEIAELSGHFIYDVVEDREGNLWFADYYDGLYRYNGRTDEWTHYVHDPADSLSLCHNKQVKIHIDHKDRLWFCSAGGGVCRYDYESDSFIPLRIRDRKGQSIKLFLVYGILNDDEGNLWLSSNNGIYNCTEDGELIRHFTYEEGLQSNQFNYRAAFRSSTGKLYFGGIYGFNIFNPDSITGNMSRPTVSVSVSYNDGDKEYVIKRIAGKENIILPRSTDRISIGMECLNNYSSPTQNEFAYRIDGDEQWHFTRETAINFMNFPYGKHSMEIRARSFEGKWSENTVKLHINNLPPAMKSLAAKIIYILLALSVLFVVIIYFERRWRKYREENVGAPNREWIEQVTAYCEQHINEPEISIDALAAYMNVSRSAFQRKIKALTGLTPVLFIRDMRLKKAAELLATHSYRVNEVCYMVGFNKPSYFSALFKKQYGILPKDYKKS